MVDYGSTMAHVKQDLRDHCRSTHAEEWNREREMQAKYRKSLSDRGRRVESKLYMDGRTEINENACKRSDIFGYPHILYHFLYWAELGRAKLWGDIPGPKLFANQKASSSMGCSPAEKANQGIGERGM